jgi:hypothetical protein
LFVVVEVDDVDEVDVLVVVGVVVVVTAELLLDEVVLEVFVPVEVVGFGVVDTGGSPAASTPMKRFLVSFRAARGTDVCGGGGFSHRRTWMSCTRYSQQLEPGSASRG